MTATAPQHDLAFVRDFPPMGGGIARMMAALAQGYPANGLIVSTGSTPGSHASDAGSSQAIDRVPVDVDRLRTIPGLLAWSRRGVALARDPAARFAWCDTIRPAAYVAHWAYRRARLPYGVIVVGNDVLQLRAKVAAGVLKRRLFRSILERASVFVAISQWTAAQCRQLLDELGLPSGGLRVRTIPLGTDPERFRADPAAAAAFRHRRGLPEGRWLVTVARLVDHKGIDIGIRTIARLRVMHPDLHYAIIGRGPNDAALRSLAGALDVADRVHLLTDVDDDELPAAYSLGEIYLGLTRETAREVEGFGISLVESAACSVPVVAARSGGIADAVMHDETGLLVDADDHAEVERAVRRLLGDAALRHRMGAAGRDRVERYLNWTRVVEEMRSVAAALGRQPPGSPTP